VSYVKFKTPEKLQDQIKSGLNQITQSKDSKIRKGMNETTKSIERGTAKLVIMSEDVTPPEILFHIPILCDEKGIPYGYVSSQQDLGNAVRINVSSSSVAIEDAGSEEKVLTDLINKLKNLK